MGTWLGRTKSAESSAPHLAKSLRGNEIYTHILLHSLSHALSHAPFLSHRSSFSHFQTFNPSLLDSTLWVYKKQKNPSLFCCYCTFEVFSCNDPQSRKTLQARIQNSKVKSRASLLCNRAHNSPLFWPAPLCQASLCFLAPLLISLLALLQSSGRSRFGYAHLLQGGYPCLSSPILRRAVLAKPAKIYPR